MRAVNVLCPAVIAMFIILLCPSFVSAQHSCGSYATTHEERQFLLENVVNLPLDRNSSTTAVPINAIIVRQDNSDGAMSIIELNYALSALNYYYKSAGIEFYFSRHPYYINSTDLYNYDERSTDLNGGDSDNQYNAFGGEVNNAINIYFVNTITRANGNRVSGFAYYPSALAKSNRMFVSQNAILNNNTIAHELGHYFGLMHTHESTENGTTDESAEHVERSGAHFNADKAGDMIADTDADPRYRTTEFDEAACSYIGTGKDIFGKSFTPPVGNIMSYFPSRCGMSFTKGQYARIAQGVKTRMAQTSFTLDAAPMMVATPTQLVARLDSVRNSIVLTWKDVATNEIGYIIERSLNPTSGFEVMVGAVTAQNENKFEDKSIRSNTQYYYRIKATNANINAYSNVAALKTQLLYCIPSLGTDNATITRFEIKANEALLLFNQGYNGISYSNFCDKLVSLTAGKTYKFTANFNANQVFAIWADFDQNGEFDTQKEILFSTNASGRQVANEFKLPIGVKPGAYRLRVRCANSSAVLAACGFDNDTQTHDYTMVVKAGVANETIKLNAIQQAQKIALTWTSTQVVNGDYFILEHSQNGETFDAVGNITATKGELHFEHEAPNFGTNHYRLSKANGIMATKEVVATVLTQFEVADDVTLVPNPATTETKLTFVAPKDGTAYVDVYDSEGSLMQHHFVKTTQGNNNLTLQVSDLETGVYYVRVSQAAKPQQTVAFVKQ
jgi:hypothetical protein